MVKAGGVSRGPFEEAALRSLAATAQRLLSGQRPDQSFVVRVKPFDRGEPNGPSGCNARAVQDEHRPLAGMDANASTNRVNDNSFKKAA